MLHCLALRHRHSRPYQHLLHHLRRPSMQSRQHLIETPKCRKWVKNAMGMQCESPLGSINSSKLGKWVEWGNNSTAPDNQNHKTNTHLDTGNTTVNGQTLLDFSIDLCSAATCSGPLHLIHLVRVTLISFNPLYYLMIRRQNCKSISATVRLGTPGRV